MNRRNRKDFVTKVADNVLATLENDYLSTDEILGIGLEAFDTYMDNLEHPANAENMSIKASVEKAKEKQLDIKKAVKHPGAFHEWCVEHGYEKVTPECIEKGLQDPDPVVRRRARFAKVLLELQKKRQEKAKKKNRKK